MPNPVAIVDLFSGPGGLGEGFARVRDGEGRPRFRIDVSIECEAAAHRTLRLRAFLRHFDQPPPEYLDWINSGTAQPDWSSLYPKHWQAANDEARCMRLGESQTTAFLSDRIQRLRSRVGHRSILIGGPPCQAYSLVGRARNRGIRSYAPERDHRNFLYEEYVRILRELEPEVFVMENVKGMLSASVAGRRIFEQVRADLEASGYSLVALAPKARSDDHGASDDLQPSDFVIRAEEHGVPQARHRVIIVGVRKDAELSGQSPRLAGDAEPASVRHVLGALHGLRSGISRSDSPQAWIAAVRTACSVVRRATRDMTEWRGARFQEVLTEVEESLVAVASRGRVGHQPSVVGEECPAPLAEWLATPGITRLPNMETRGHMREDLGRYLFAAIFAAIHRYSPKADDFPASLAPLHANWRSGKFADRFRVQAYDAPSSTVTSHISKDGHYFIHPDPTQCRSLTVREAARLQTFPDDYVFLGNRTEQYVQVGNAVPPYLAYQIALAIAPLFE